MADGTLQSNRHHCAAPLSNDVVRSFETTHWTVLPFIRDSFYWLCYWCHYKCILWIHQCFAGPMCLHFLIGAPPVIVFSSACAGLAGGAAPSLAQLASSSYHAAY
ncbi:hypothetical protein AAHE18_08G128500 [Arachis hypogaea]